MRGRTIVLVLLAVGFSCPFPVSAQGPDVADPDRIAALEREAAEARAPVIAAQRRLNAAVAEFERADTELVTVRTRLQVAQRRLDAVLTDLQAARDVMAGRAAALYRRGRVGLLDTLLSVRSFAQFMDAAVQVSAIARADQASVDRFVALKAEAEETREQIAEHERSVASAVAALAARQRAIQDRTRRLAAILATAEGALGREEGKFRFPVRPPYSYVNTFGAPRMEGTRYAHSHEGNDIFAPYGTALIACVSGTVFDVGVAPLGGKKLWIRADDGYTYYYAHLSAWAPAARSGARIKAGTVVGYVGTTGNAVGTPPHLHFEIHAPGGRAIDPYGTLRRADRLAG